MSNGRGVHAEGRAWLIEHRKVWVSTLILIPLLWAGLNAKLSAWVSSGTPLTLGGLRSLGPLIALSLGASIILLGTSRLSGKRQVRPWELPIPVHLFVGIGLIGLLVGVVRSPGLLYSLDWGIGFLAVPVGFLALYALGSPRTARPALLVTGAIVAIIATILFGFAVVTFDILSLGIGYIEGRPFVYRDYEPLTQAFLINANGAARFGVIAAIMSLATGLCTDKRWLQAALAIPFTLFVVMVVATQSRSGLIGLFVAASLVFLLSQGIKRSLAAGGIGLALAAATGVLSDAVSALTRSGIQDLWRFTNRDHIWADGLQAIATHPILGWGFQTDRLIIGEHLHQAWLQTWFQTGLVGLVLFAAAWILVTRSIYRTSRTPDDADTRAVDDPVHLAAIGTFAFLLLRSIPESTGAFYGVDLLLLVPLFGYFWTAEQETRALDETQAPDWTPTTPRDGLSRGRTVLVSAFACRPPDSEDFHGGEDMLGWSLVSRLAKHHHLHVLTCTSNQKALEGREKITKHGSLTFYYVDTPFSGWDRNDGQRRGPLQLYAYLWQIQASRVARKLRKQLNVDLYHHLTYANDWMASHASVRLDRPVVRGPGGSGPSIPAPFRKRLPLEDRAWETVRMLGRHPFRWDLWFIAGQAKTHHLLVCNHEAMERLPPAWRAKADYFPVIGINDEDLEQTQNGHGPEPSADEPFTLITAGKQLPSKGFEWAIRAFARFHQTAPESRFVLVGDGPDRERLEALSHDLGVGDAIEFTGWLPTRNDVLDAMAQGHVFLYPSLHDGGGAVVLEGMACGLPPIVFDLGGPGLHVDEEYGYKFDPEDPDAAVEQMAEALVELYEDPKNRLAMSQAARERVKEAYLWDVLTHRMLEVYGDAIAHGW